MTTVRFIASADPKVLQAALDGRASATVEAEYGDALVSGSVVTMAHHGPRAGQKAPCAYEADEIPNRESIEVVGLSHVDLDSLGGCAAILGCKPENAAFWRLAEFVDLNGPHKLGQSGAAEPELRAIRSFWAWSQTNRGPRITSEIIDVTEYVVGAINTLHKILGGDDLLLAGGDKFAANQRELNAGSWLETKDGVVVRVSGQFCNSLYDDPAGNVGKAVVAFNTLSGALTVSLADPIPGVSCVRLVQALFGELAGGHAGIAGSPRGQRMSLKDLQALAEATRTALLTAPGQQ